MALQANGDLLLIGRGKVFFKRNEAAGTAQGFKFLGQTTKLQIQMNAEKATERSAVEAAAPIVKEVTIQVSPELNLTLKEFDADNLALAMMGTKSSYTQAATPITNEVFADVKQGHFYKLAKRGPITAVNVEPSPSGTAYVLDTDYTIEDATTPLIKIKVGGGIADGADIQVDYTPTAIVTGLDQVRGAVANVIEGALMFLPDNLTGPKWQVEVWKMSLSSDAVLDLIQQAAEFAAVDLKGAVLSDATLHPNEPYYLMTKLT